MKIAVIPPPLLQIPPRAYGGLEIIVADLCEALAKAGQDVTLYAPKGSHAEGCKVFETIQAKETTQCNWVQEEVNAYNAYAAHLVSGGYDIIHDHTWFGTPYLAKMQKPELKIVHTHHGHIDWKPDAKPANTPHLNLIGISKYMRREYEAQGLPSRYAYNGINLDKYPYSAEKGDRLIFVGRFSTFKMPHISLDLAKDTGHQIDLVGGSFVAPDEVPFLNYIKMRCMQGEGVMHIDASHEKKIELLQKAKACIVPSHFSEPFGLCMPPDSKIVTSDGLKSISDVKIGDSVLTHNGDYRSVTHLHHREYSGDLVHIRSNGVPEIVLTPEHPCYVMKRVGVKGFFAKPEWVNASDITKGDVLVYPLVINVIPVDEIDMSKYGDVTEDGEFVVSTCTNQYGADHQILNCNKIPRKIKVTPNLMRMFGYYLSEGSASPNGCVSFAFHRKENNYISDLIDILKTTFGLEATIRDRLPAQTREVYVCSGILRDMIIDNFGKGAHNKKIPKWIITLPPDLQIHLAVGMYRGDGHCDNEYGSCKYSTVSPSLAWGYSTILFRNKINNSVTSAVARGFQNKSSWGKSDLYSVVSSYENGSKLLDADGYSKHPKISRERRRPFHRRWSYKSSIYSLVREVSFKSFSGEVFNLSVDEDETYCTISALVHNCAAESLACGTPVIALNDGALSEVVGTDGKSGFVCNTYDDMIRAVENLDKIRPINCRKRAEMFSREKMATRYMELYKEAIDGKEW